MNFKVSNKFSVGDEVISTAKFGYGLTMEGSIGIITHFSDNDWIECRWSVLTGENVPEMTDIDKKDPLFTIKLQDIRKLTKLDKVLR